MLLISGKMDSSIQHVLVLLSFNPFFTIVTFGYYLETLASAAKYCADSVAFGGNTATT